MTHSHQKRSWDESGHILTHEHIFLKKVDNYYINSIYLSFINVIRKFLDELSKKEKSFT